MINKHSEHSNYSNHNHKNLIINNKYSVWAIYASVSCSFFVCLIKFAGWMKTDSISMLASLVDAMIDMISSIINMIALKYALLPPDEDHRFGHNKAEDLACFMQATFFGSSGLFLIFNCINRFSKPVNIEHSFFGMLVMIICTVITLSLVLFQRYIIKKTKSIIVETDSFHYLTDLFSNIAVIISIWSTNFFKNPNIDNIIGACIGLYIIKGSYSLLRKSFNNLMDHELGEDEKFEIIKIIEAHKDVRSMHDLKTRYAGSKAFIQFHVVLDSSISLYKANQIAENIEKDIIEAFPGSEVIIHQDPDK